MANISQKFKYITHGQYTAKYVVRIAEYPNNDQLSHHILLSFDILNQF